jgi:hypothetical protein
MSTVNFSTIDYLEFLFSNQMLYHCAQVWSAVAHLRKGEPFSFKPRGKIKSLGIKEFGINFQRFQVEEFLKKNSDIAVIHLVRDNLLQRYLSLESLQRHHIVATTNASLSLGKMRIDIANMLATLELLSQERKYEHSLMQSLSGNPTFHIRYEDAYTNAETLRGMLKQVFEFLEVPPIDTLSNQRNSQRKILPKRIEEIVENYDEVVEAIRPTCYAQYLD